MPHDESHRLLQALVVLNLVSQLLLDKILKLLPSLTLIHVEVKLYGVYDEIVLEILCIRFNKNLLFLNLLPQNHQDRRYAVFILDQWSVLFHELCFEQNGLDVLPDGFLTVGGWQDVRCFDLRLLWLFDKEVGWRIFDTPGLGLVLKS